MKRLSILSMILLITINLLCEQTHSEYDQFMTYKEDPTSENFIKAVEHYNSQLSGDIKYTARLMLCYLHNMEFQKNMEVLKMDIDSLNAKTMFSYANILLENEKYEESIDVYNKLNENYPNWSCPWRHKGEAYFKWGKLEDAELSLIKAIETRIEHYDAYVMLADVQNNMGKSEQALETLETGLSYKGKDIEDPDEEVSDLDVQFLYLNLLKKNNKTEKIKVLEKKLKEIAPEDDRWN
ncbi:MAG: hypothetical protein K8R49_00010 [Candidatus Cloacimonetes bacterium]|nr:hypothetical protein [Candidatus Cloacimonadota bacterium]